MKISLTAGSSLELNQPNYRSNTDNGEGNDRGMVKLVKIG